MGKVFDGIDARLGRWIAAQPLFFVASAPLDGGHVNVSPKGPIETLRVLDARTIAYLDLIGSGAETIAHVRENGRICVMLCAFSGPPRIVRLHGRGEVLLPGDPACDELGSAFDLPDTVAVDPGRRAVVRVRLDRISDSCGYGVPLMRHEGARPQQPAWVERKIAQGGPDALAKYVATHNARSIDGLPALDGAPADLGR
jgi:Pyridoxamine 5'-phosphate oxidase